MSNIYVDFGSEALAAPEAAQTQPQQIAVEHHPARQAEIDSLPEYALVGGVILAITAPIALSVWLNRRKPE